MQINLKYLSKPSKENNPIFELQIQTIIQLLFRVK